MPEIALINDFKDWPETVRAVQANELLAAVLPVATLDQVEAASDIREQDGMYCGYLFSDQLPAEFNQALIEAHNVSATPKLETMPTDISWPLYARAVTGLHVDGYNPLQPLSHNFVVKEAVDITFIPLDEDDLYKVKESVWPERIARHIETQGTEEVISERAARALGGACITLTAGELITFSGYGSHLIRRPVAHQFVSHGATFDEQEERLSAFIKTDKVNYWRHPNLPARTMSTKN
jgi:hypothetical protein